MTKKQMVKAKRGLLLTVLQAKLENTIYEMLEDGKFSSIDELDAKLEEILTEYDSQCHMVNNYYHEKNGRSK